MLHQSEAKFQGWRALAEFADGGECLLYVGRSTTHVRAGYAAAFTEMLDAGERARVSKIALQCWQGAADQGFWLTKSALPVPGALPRGVPVPVTAETESADGADTVDRAEVDSWVLPFTRSEEASPAFTARKAVGSR